MIDMMDENKILKDILQYIFNNHQIDYAMFSDFLFVVLIQYEDKEGIYTMDEFIKEMHEHDKNRDAVSKIRGFIFQDLVAVELLICNENNI